jgi:prepilin-type processing-associated H-X9-DG protein
MGEFGSYTINASYTENDAVPDSWNPPVAWGWGINWSTGVLSAFRNTKLSQIAAPSTTVWVGDIVPHFNGPYSWRTAYDGSGIPGIFTDANNGRGFAMLGANNGGDATFLTARHLDTTNLLFCDGHVKSFRLDALRAPASNNANVMKFFTIEDD